MEYRVIRTQRKTIALEVTRALEVVVRAPRGMSEQAVSRFVMSHQNWLAAAIGRQTERAAKHPEPTEAEEQALRHKAKIQLPEKVRHYAETMGVFPTGIRITSARTRFGSCSAKNSLSFSWRLMQYPDEAIDYVVVHELAHIRHHDHSRAFYAFVSETMPDYRQRAKLLKE